MRISPRSPKSQLIEIRGRWCKRCGYCESADITTAKRCPRCRASLHNFESQEFGLWQILQEREHLWQLVEHETWGVGPALAAMMLGCHRTMIDKLVDRRLLERSESVGDGYDSTVISQRSIDRVLAAKRTTGKWTKGNATGKGLGVEELAKVVSRALRNAEEHLSRKGPALSQKRKTKDEEEK